MRAPPLESTQDIESFHLSGHTIYKFSWFSLNSSGALKGLNKRGRQRECLDPAKHKLVTQLIV